ncbi:MAG: hypothetical protein IRY91_05445 [Gemmatimonadaceae bacterium]|nr:hypothetical protein [Gemmatimonadaceae bacterium]
MTLRPAVSFGALLAACVTIAAACSGDSAASSGAPGARASEATLAAVRARGAVKCGVSQAAGVATPNDAGQWQGFDVDFCRALAVAVFDDPAKVEIVPYTMQQRFSGL